MVVVAHTSSLPSPHFFPSPAYAHERGVHVEAEIGKIKGRGYEPSYAGEDFLVQVPDAVALTAATGVPKEDVQQAIKLGINKVNVGTQLQFTYHKTVQGILGTGDIKGNTGEIYQAVLKAVCEDEKEWIIICMADGKA